MIILFGSEGGPRGRNDVLMKVAGRGCTDRGEYSYLNIWQKLNWTEKKTDTFRYTYRNAQVISLMCRGNLGNLLFKDYQA